MILPVPDPERFEHALEQAERARDDIETTLSKLPLPSPGSTEKYSIPRGVWIDLTRAVGGLMSALDYTANEVRVRCCGLPESEAQYPVGAPGDTPQLLESRIGEVFQGLDNKNRKLFDLIVERQKVWLKVLKDLNDAKKHQSALRLELRVRNVMTIRAGYRSPIISFYYLRTPEIPDIGLFLRIAHQEVLRLLKDIGAGMDGTLQQDGKSPGDRANQAAAPGAVTPDLLKAAIYWIAGGIVGTDSKQPE